MDFSSPRRRPNALESSVPMINVVFLLLIFFLMSASIAPPEPFEVSVPTAEAEPLERFGPDTFYVSANGDFAYGDARNEAAVSAVANHPEDTVLTLRVDARWPAAQLAALLPKLTALGITSTQLVTGER